MLDKLETEEALNAWGVDIVKFARINLGDRNRPKKSTLTGKVRKGKINFSGDLSESLDYNLKVSKNSFGFQISGLDYADVVDGGRRKGKGIPLAPLIHWVEKKPIRLRKDNKFIKMTDENRKAFAGFVSWKAKKYGIAPTNFLRDAVEDASKKHEADLTEALFKDIEQATTSIIRQLQSNR